MSLLSSYLTPLTVTRLWNSDMLSLLYQSSHALIIESALFLTLYPLFAKNSLIILSLLKFSLSILLNQYIL
nr:MAG TPA: hypothetical protein [Caudoviricetes sp.]